MSPLVTPQWLNQRLNDSNLIILDASIEFQIPGEVQKDTVNLIPNTLRFDYDKEFCDIESCLPHMMPSEERFIGLLQELGLNNESIVVIYDNSGTYASPRAWWMLKAMGHQQVYILDGGLTEWKQQGFETVQQYDQPHKLGNFVGNLDTRYFVDAEYVLQQIKNQDSLTVDARSRARFNQEVPEPRSGIRSGHIPNSVCQPFVDLMDSHKLKPVSELRSILSSSLSNHVSSTIFSCGSGVTAAIVLLAAHLCDYQGLSIYDGSWTEWGQRTELPIE